MWHRSHNHNHFAKHFTKWLQLHQRSHFTRVATAVLATAEALPNGPLLFRPDWVPQNRTSSCRIWTQCRTFWWATITTVAYLSSGLWGSVNSLGMTNLRYFRKNRLHNFKIGTRTYQRRYKNLQVSEALMYVPGKRRSKTTGLTSGDTKYSTLLGANKVPKLLELFSQGLFSTLQSLCWYCSIKARAHTKTHHHLLAKGYGFSPVLWWCLEKPGYTLG
jgi:hypothetical protein